MVRLDTQSGQDHAAARRERGAEEGHSLARPAVAAGRQPAIARAAGGAKQHHCAAAERCRP
jgi:hypothetical protein